MENAGAIRVQPNSGTTMGPAAACSSSGCIMPPWPPSGQGSERLNAQLLVDSIPALIHTAKPDGYLDYFNKPWLEYLGVTLDKVAGWNWTAYVHPEDVDGIVAQWRACLATGEVFEYETRVRRANGDYRWMFHRRVPFYDANGNIVKWYGSSLDIEERKTAEEALRISEAYLAEAQNLSHTGSWAWNPATGHPSYWSEECYRVLGFDPAEALPLSETFFQRIQPDEAQATIREQFYRAVRDKADFELEMSFVHPARGIRNIRTTGHAVVDTRGDLRELVGTVIDVTERKRAEEELRRSEMELRQILDLAPQHIVVYGPNGERLYANRVALDYLGFSLEEWRQSPDPGNYVHPDDTERLDGVFDRAVARASADELELRVRKNDGSYRWFLARFNPLRNEQGQISRWYIAGTDIEDRKQAEERLRRENVALREEIDKASM
jgi:PAS domain S-box-containing protein